MAPWRQPVMHSPHSVQPLRAGPAPPKYGSATSTPGSPKYTPTGVGTNVSAGAHFFGDGPHHLIGRGHGRVRNDAEHALCLVVERCQFGTPVGDVAPAGVGEESREGLVERVAVDQRTSPHTHARRAPSRFSGETASGFRAALFSVPKRTSAAATKSSGTSSRRSGGRTRGPRRDIPSRSDGAPPCCPQSRCRQL